MCVCMFDKIIVSATAVFDKITSLLSENFLINTLSDKRALITGYNRTVYENYSKTMANQSKHYCANLWKKFHSYIFFFCKIGYRNVENGV